MEQKHLPGWLTVWGKQKNRYEIIQKANTVEALQNGRLGDRRKWRLWRDLNKSQCMDCPPKKEMAVVERWPVSGGSTVSYFVEVPRRFCSLSCKVFLYQVTVSCK